MPYKQIKAHAAATRANLSGGAAAKAGSNTTAAAAEDSHPTPPRQPNGKKHKGGRASSGKNHSITSFVGASGAKIVSEDDASMDPNEQLQDEMRRANREDDDDEDVHMAD